MEREYRKPSPPPLVPEAMTREEPGAAALAAKRPEWRLSSPDGSEAIDLDLLQGLWTEAQYLRLTDAATRLLEFTDGHLEILPMPTDRHQVILRSLFLALFPFVQDRGGTLLFAPLRLRIRKDKFRDPDLLLVHDANDARRRNDYWRGADWVAEVVSPDRPGRDTLTKRLDYAEARIPEYWIVNPVDETVTVLVLDDDAYAEAGVFRRGERAASRALPGFAIGVDDLFDAR